MKYFLIVLSLFSLAQEPVSGINPFAKWTKTELTLCNSLVRRNIQLPTVDGTFVTTSYKPVTGDFNYFSYSCSDFQFEADDVVYSGKTKWELVKIQYAGDSNDERSRCNSYKQRPEN